MAKTKELTELGQWKVGQRVLVTQSGGESIRPITRITDGRGGTIYVDIKPPIAKELQADYKPYELVFDINGSERAGDKWNRNHISIATEADTIRIRGKNASRRIANIEWSKIAPEKILEIEKLLNDNGIQTK